MHSVFNILVSSGAIQGKINEQVPIFSEQTVLFTFFNSSMSCDRQAPMFEYSVRRIVIVEPATYLDTAIGGPSPISDWNRGKGVP